MAQPKIISLTELNKQEVDTFLKKVFPPRKAHFLIEHGYWLHQGNENRFAFVLDQRIIGYCGIIPTTVYRNDNLTKAFWWIDLVISKDFRGNGYQSLFDEYVRNRPEIKLGFPNKYAAKIHRKHGWQVFGHLKVLMFPIDFSRASLFRHKESFMSSIISQILSPMKYHKMKYSTKWSKKSSNPKIEDYVDIFSSTNKGQFTTLRNKNYFQWRYLNSPFYKEYDFYYCKKSKQSQIALIIRSIKTEKGLIIRIVDLYGAIWDYSAVQDIIHMVVADSIKMGAIQITILESNPRIQRLLFRCGFIFFTKARFCYFDNSKINNGLNKSMRWTLADSDNDFLD